jgi:hypothetical protein
MQGDFLLAAHTFEDIFHLTIGRPVGPPVALRSGVLRRSDEKIRRRNSAFGRSDKRNWTLPFPPTWATLLTESLAAQNKIKNHSILLGKGSDKKRSMENSYRLIWARAAQGIIQKAVYLANDFLNQGEDPGTDPADPSAYRRMPLSGWANEAGSVCHLSVGGGTFFRHTLRGQSRGIVLH